MTVWQWWWWLWWSVAGLTVAVIPESDGGGYSRRDSAFLGISRCPATCSCILPRYVECQASPGDTHPPLLARDTTTLILHGYSSVPTSFLARFHNLRHLTINDSLMNNLSIIPYLPSLEQLVFTHSHLQSVSGSRLHENVPKLSHLNLSFNTLTMLNNSDLVGLRHLQVLDLHHNPISKIEINTFNDLTSLRYLDVSRTQLSTLHHDWITHALKLQYLNISNSRLEVLPRLNGNSLKVFDASHNFLNVLPDGMVSGVKHLRRLLLHHNPLQHVGVASFSKANELEILDLSHTNLINIDEFVFSDMPLLRELHLHHNKKLLRIEHGAFSGLHKLQLLTMSHTPSLTEVEEVAFNGLPELHTLNLQHSGLTVLPHSIINLVNTSILLDGTQLHCDCYHSWLPALLKTTNISLWSGVTPLSCTDGYFRSKTQLIIHIESLGCQAPLAITPSGNWVVVQGDQSALLECNITAYPSHAVLWLSSNQEIFKYNESKQEEWTSHHLREIQEAASYDPRIEVLGSGHLLIRQATRSDAGRYKCFAYNSVGNTTVITFLGMDDTPLRNLYTESLLFGFACAALFLLITLIVQLVNYCMDRLGWQCCCCRDRLSPKARQVRRLLESVESYKTQQLERLRDNYNAQVVSIKDSCYQQMDRIRDSYSGQAKHLKDLRDYSTQGLTTMRDQYLDQVNKVRDYSVVQMNRVRENYVFQRNRIRKFSAHQLLRLRETYKFQQKTLNKILENLPDLYLQNCRTGGCQRSDSILFDDALYGIDAYYKVDFLDTQSHGSDYFTPASTLTRSYRSSKGQDPTKRHSRTSSNTSSDFVEAQSWIRRDSGSVNGSSPGHMPIYGRSHSRSLSMATPTSYIPDPVRVHKRSLSATHPTRRFVPAPELRGVPARITLCEEVSDYDLATPPTSPNSAPNTPTLQTKQKVVPPTAKLNTKSTEKKMNMHTAVASKWSNEAINENTSGESTDANIQENTSVASEKKDSECGDPSTSYETSL